MPDLSPTAEAIRQYKLNANRGYAAWSKVLCTDDYRMHVPSMGFDVVGPLEVEEIIFGWLTDIGAKQGLSEIIEFGSYVTCYLQITDQDGGILDVVEAFKVDDTGKIEEFWAL